MAKRNKISLPHETSNMTVPATMRPAFDMLDMIGGMDFKADDEPSSYDKRFTKLEKSIVRLLNGPQKESVERLAFEIDPNRGEEHAGIYKRKQRLLPNDVLKRLSIQDDQVAAIVRARSAHLFPFGQRRKDRFSLGFDIEIKDEHKQLLDSPEIKEKFQKHVKRACDLLETCGSTENIKKKDRMTFSSFLSQSTRNVCVFGMAATEKIYTIDPRTGQQVFHSFRPIDAGTIYQAVPGSQAHGDNVRKRALDTLRRIKGASFDESKYYNDEYVWYQVTEGLPTQAFTEKECVVYNFYPVTDVELVGYPLTPLDTVISAVTTHINITTHNKVYFQSGRAARGMLVIKSEDMDETILQGLKQQFNASINSVGNAWRMPVFSVGENDDVSWQSIDNSGRDMEFQFLADSVSRILLSAFMMSPEELPGYGHLSRGTNSQAMSESNSEYKLEAARDVGIRPMISQWEDHINADIFPEIDPWLASVAKVRFLGLDSETSEREALQLEKDAPIHMTYNQIMEKVDKERIDRKLGGDFPLNPNLQSLLDKYYTVGEVKEYFLGHDGASKDPNLAYRRDPFFFEWLNYQLKLENSKRELDLQEAQLGTAQQGAQAQETHPPVPGGEIYSGLDQAIDVLSKSENSLTPNQRLLLKQQKETVSSFMEVWEDEVRKVTDSIMKDVSRFV